MVNFCVFFVPHIWTSLLKHSQQYFVLLSKKVLVAGLLGDNGMAWSRGWGIVVASRVLVEFSFFFFSCLVFINLN